MLVPSALAYATIAGVPPVVGLYAAPAALILYAALGSSRQLITGPSAAAAALSAAVVGNAVAGNGGQFVATTAALAICVGLAALIAGLLRLGFVASFISEPVLKGFIVGLSLTIIVGQVPKLFGVESGSGDFFERAWDFLINIDETDGLTLLVGVGSLAVLFGLPRVAPAIPGPLAAVVLGIGAVELFDLGAHGVAIVGSIDPGLPSLAAPRRQPRPLRGPGGCGSGSDARRLRGEPRDREDLRPARAPGDRPEPGADRPRRREPRRRDLRWVRRQREPLEDSGEQHRRRANPARRSDRRRPDDAHPALSHRLFREPAGGDPGGDSDRRPDRPDRPLGATRFLPRVHAAGSAEPTASRLGRTSSRRSPRCLG